MKKLTKREEMIILGLLILCFGYLIGSFISLSFNIANWTESFRGLIAGSSIFGAIVALVVYHESE